MDQDQKSASKPYDLTIIGAGSGGLIAGRVAVSLGARVLLIDKERLGGDCLRYGCVPSKSLIHVARLAQQAKNAGRIGLTAGGSEIDMVKDSGYIQTVLKQVEIHDASLLQGQDVRHGKAD